MLCLRIIAIVFGVCISLNTFAIRNGSADSNNKFSNVHKFHFTYWYNGRVVKSSFCTGTVIGDYTILTAAHCTKPVRGYTNYLLWIGNTSMLIDSVIIPDGHDDRYNNWKYHFRNFININRRLNENNPSENRTIEYYKTISQNAFKSLTAYDIALIRTHYKIPSYLMRTKLNFNHQPAGSYTYSVGYGHTYYSYNYRRYMYPNIPYYRSGKLWGGSNDAHEVWSHNTSDRITSPGDSGGPLMLQNSMEQIGVLGGQIEYKYVNSSIYSKLENQAKFIQYFLK